jgi:hypothetical protein
MRTIILALLLLLSTFVAYGNEPIRIKVLSANESGGGRSITIRINQRISLDLVKTIATEIKKKEDITYSKYSVFFLLPNQKDGAGAWARALFEPNLKAEILGATVEDVEKFHKFSILNGWRTPKKVDMRRSPLFAALADDGPATYQNGGKILGEWISDQHGAACKMTLFTKGGTTYLNSYFPDGSQGTVEYATKKIKQGLRLDERYRIDNPSGDYYVVNRKGQLEFRDKDGLFMTLLPEKKDRNRL